MGAEPPYIYHQASTSSFIAPSDRGFSSKAGTPAPCTPTEPFPNRAAPMSNVGGMNRSGESYFVTTRCYRETKWEPMSKSTKPAIKWSRVVLLNLRICALLGALGLLFCIICIKPTQLSVDWILRVTPGLGVLHGLYGVYHLSRPAKSRTPASSASYMVFAAVFDAGIVPFLAFTAFMADSEMMLPANANGHWQTQFFSQKFQTSTIVYATYLVSMAEGAAHVVAFGLSIYLAVMFRRISKLPPDMNPLEDNLTSRHSHKRNKSSISTITTEPAKPSNTVDQPLIEKSRDLPYGHSRGLSSDSLPPSPHRRPGPPNARDSPMSFYAIPYQPSPAPPRSSHTDLRRSPPRAANRNSAPPINGNRSPTRGSPRPRPHSQYPVSSNRSNEDNWLTYPSPPSSPVNQAGTAPPELQHLRQGRASRGTTPDVVATAPRLMPLASNAPTKFQLANRSPKPLGMNPPTPPVAKVTSPGAEYARNPYRSPTREQRQALRDLTDNATGLAVNGSPMTWEEVNLRPSKEHRVSEAVEGVQGAAGKDKGRFYGSLKGMIGGRKSGDGYMEEEREEKTKLVRGKTAGKRGGRVVSSGVDGTRRGGLRAREVSGKVAEEGRSVMLH